jgi:hypothetical protein
MFKVAIHVWIFTEDRGAHPKGVCLEKKMELPFVPFPGLSLQVEEKSSRGPEDAQMVIRLEDVHFNPFDGVFLVTVADSDLLLTAEQAETRVGWLRGAGFAEETGGDAPPPRSRPRLVRD